MYRIMLVCENGASTGIVMKKMQKYADDNSISVKVEAHPYAELGEFIAKADYVLLGPQIGYKKEETQQEYPVYAKKIDVIKPMDFGMLNGEKILLETIAAIEKNV